MARSLIIALLAAAVSATGACTPGAAETPSAAPETPAPASVDGEPGAGEGLALSREIDDCQGLHKLARSRVHDCEWAGTLLHQSRVLAGTCDTGSLRAYLREAHAIYETCGPRQQEQPRDPPLRTDAL